ncbi:pyridoxal phosphate-dependent decarboxylase family protein [Inhella proteolytica]|uniref:Aspartate aminotransferase family protein n=1 Tax=Inhella proteolytica TaxID=2795029 RepID=A0A931J5M3_9BURK|nr:pyridoxal-dependent decarboxylase [Inhella proteolytica]MBH9577302.1 aspartate aminotransferase family protein [Inhella proteolytica]
MSPLQAQELHTLPTLMNQAAQAAIATLQALPERPAAVRPQSVPRQPLAAQGLGLAAALADFEQRYAPGFAASAGPRYLGFVTGGATPAALAGDWLASAWDQNPTSGLDSSAPDLERECIAWLAALFGLGPEWSGSFVTGATMSNFVGLALGREWLSRELGGSAAQQGLCDLPPLRILSGAPHSSIHKAAAMLGLGRSAVQAVPQLPGREAVNPAALAAALQAGPAIVVANAGTVNSVDFDDLQALAALRTQQPFWLHVDAAFGAFAALLPEHAPKLAGLNQADSICVDLHKWLNVPYDAAVQFTRRQDLQTAVFQNQAAYLGDLGEQPDFVHLTPENSRRLRALPAWFALQAYGREGAAAVVRQCVELAQALGRWIEGGSTWRLLAPVRLNVVCFTPADLPAGAAGRARIEALVTALRDRGEVFLTPTLFNGHWGLRAAFSNWRTQPADLLRLQDELARVSAI